MKNLISIIFALLLSLCSVAQSTEIPIEIPLSGFWNGFYGKIDTSDANIVFYLFANGDVKGDFWYNKDLIKKNVSGRIINQHITLTEYTNHRITGHLIGVIDTGDYIIISGVWQDSAGTQSEPFRMTHGSIEGGTFNHRYTNCIPYGSEEDVDSFARMLKNAILTNDKEWIADHILYPLGTSGINHKVEYKIKNKSDFVKKFDEIFTKDYKNKVKSWPPFDLSCGHIGVAFGNIWILNSENSNENNFHFGVIKIL